MNHEFFWDTLAPVSQGGGALPDPGTGLHTMMTEEWGSIENFQQLFNSRTALVQGSGWGWLLYNKNTGALNYRTTSNQDTPMDISPVLVPLLTIDVWEHAYYLDYKNLRPVFLKNMWQIINWKKVAERLEAAKKLE